MKEPPAPRAFAPELIYHRGRFERHKAVVVTASGSIASVEDAALHPQAIRLPDRALLCGLVNAHSHSFQRIFRGHTENPLAGRDNFWSWRDAMYRAANALTPDGLFHVARMAFLEMACSGITSVGEFHYIHRTPAGQPYDDPNRIASTMVRAAREVGLRICLLRVAYARAGFRKPASPLQARFIESDPYSFLRATEALRKSLDGTHAWVGVAPHSVRAVPLDFLREVAGWAALERVPIHMHCAEQPAELDECVAEYGLTPIALLDREGLLSRHFTAVHAIHITGSESRALGEARSTVCACPTTERNLGDGIVPALALRRAGASIALGTDSQAQIDLLEDARQLEYHLRLQQLQRALHHPHDLFHAASAAGATSIGVPGHPADFFTVDLRDPSIAGAGDDHLISAIVYGLNRTAIRDVIVGGQYIVRDGKHPRHEEIVNAYLETARATNLNPHP